MGRSKKAGQSDDALGQPKVVCFFCDGVFAGEGLLVQHQQTKHFKCTECNAFPGGRCPTHGMRHKCIVTLSMHWKKDHKKELKTIPGAKEGKDDPKKFWPTHGMQGVPEEFLKECNLCARTPASWAGAIDVDGDKDVIEVPAMPDEPPPPMPELPPPPAPDSLAPPLPGIQGSLSVGEVRADPPTSNEAEVPDFARQVQEWMAAKEAEEKASRSQEQALPLPPASLSASASSNSLKYDSPMGHDLPSMETQGESSGWETVPRSQDWRSRSWDRQDADRHSRTSDRHDTGRRSRSRDRLDRDRRSRSVDRQDRALHGGPGSRSWDRRSRSRDRQNTRATFDERVQQDDRMRDDRGPRRDDRGRDDRGRDSNAARTCIAITQGYIPSRIWLQKLMTPYGRLDYSHTGSRINPERDPPWVRFATSGGAEDAMNAITAGLLMDGYGVPLKAEWKKMSDKGKGKQKEMSSRDLYRNGAGKGSGARYDRRRASRSSSSSSSRR